MISKLPKLIFVAAAVFLMGAAPAGSALVNAARNGDRALLRSLLQKGTNVNEADGDGTTALHWASYRDDLESVDILIRAGANVNAANDLGATPLWTASQNGSEAMVRRLLEAGANPNLPLLAGETPLMVASRSGNAAVVELLAAKGADVNAHGVRDQTALMWAVAQQHPGVVKVLLAHGADIHARSATWTDVEAVPPHGYLGYNKAIPHGNETALMFASLSGDVASAELLVAAGADVNDTDAWGVSATTLAAHSNYENLVEFLLDKGADPNAAKAGFSALHVAIMHHNAPMVKALLEHGADANAPLRTWTPTRRSSRDYNFAPELVGATPFWLAARFTEPDVMRLLLEHGADPRFVHHGEYLAESGRVEEGFDKRTHVTNALMAAVGMGGGTDWATLDRKEREPLMLEAMKLAADFDVDINLTDSDGRTALDAASALRYASIVKFLEEKGAKHGVAPQRGRRGAAR